MSLKQNFAKQSIWTLIGTIVITCCAGFLYHNLGIMFHTDTKGEAEIIVVEQGKVTFQTSNFSTIQIKEILMFVDIKKQDIIIDDVDYSIKVIQNHEKSMSVKLTPKSNFKDFYDGLAVFSIIVFIITFITAQATVLKYNMSAIVLPIQQLKKQTENLRIGELSAAIADEGYGEIKALGQEIEQLRLKLKDSIYYQQKYDEDRKFFISSISHDLRTPVTSVRGYIDGVLDGVASTEEKKREYLEKAIEKTKVMTGMIDDLLLHSKLDMNQIPFEFKNVDPLKLLEDCIFESAYDFELEGKKVFLENHTTDSLLISIDSEKFRRVVQNIMDNARRNIAAGGGLQVILREMSTSVIMEFKDNGKGIKQKDLPHIFDRFYRGDSARTVGGGGLGLAIAKQIVEGMGGRIWATSVFGEGASILISLKQAKGESYEKNINHRR